MNRLSLFDWFILPFSLLVFVLDGMATLAAFIMPGKFWPVSLSGIAFPYLFLLNMVFFSIWLIRRKRILLLLHALLLIAGFNSFNKHWAWNRSSATSERDSTFTVFSFNARNFDFYNWKGNYLGTSTVRHDAMELIRQLNPDIICFQEFFHCDTGKYRIKNYMTDSLGYKEQYVLMPLTLYQHHHWGMAIYSRYPVIATGEIKLPKLDKPRKGSSINLCLFADVVINQDTIRVYNAHFQSIRFSPNEYRMMLGPSVKASEENVKGLKSIIGRIKYAMELRARQVQKVILHLNESPYPVIFCTDFNDTPASWAYRQVSLKLKDSFLEKGRGTGISFSGVFPGFRIDYIFHSEKLACREFRVIRKNLSDHYPLFAGFKTGIER